MTAEIVAILVGAVIADTVIIIKLCYEVGRLKARAKQEDENDNKKRD